MRKATSDSLSFGRRVPAGELFTFGVFGDIMKSVSMDMSIFFSGRTTPPMILRLLRPDFTEPGDMSDVGDMAEAGVSVEAEELAGDVAGRMEIRSSILTGRIGAHGASLMGSVGATTGAAWAFACVCTRGTNQVPTEGLSWNARGAETALGCDTFGVAAWVSCALFGGSGVNQVPTEGLSWKAGAGDAFTFGSSCACAGADANAFGFDASTLFGSGVNQVPTEGLKWNATVAGAF
mmetsp:Transcript_35298/g.47671  ORF Transcript_35298/g.47671 Transcript_35298/m.47671 type:complete len:235 (-) Transcript_35298:207-911(-)